MTHNRCAYAPCAATLRPDGPSPYFCGENCMNAWTAAQNAARQAEPKRGMEPTFVVVDETAGIPDEVLAAADARFPRKPPRQEELVDELRYAVVPWWQRTSFRRLRKPAARFRSAR